MAQITIKLSGEQHRCGHHFYQGQQWVYSQSSELLCFDGHVKTFLPLYHLRDRSNLFLYPVTTFTEDGRSTIAAEDVYSTLANYIKKNGKKFFEFEEKHKGIPADLSVKGRELVFDLVAGLESISDSYCFRESVLEHSLFVKMDPDNDPYGRMQVKFSGMDHVGLKAPIDPNNPRNFEQCGEFLWKCFKDYSLCRFSISDDVSDLFRKLRDGQITSVRNLIMHPAMWDMNKRITFVSRLKTVLDEEFEANKKQPGPLNNAVFQKLQEESLNDNKWIPKIKKSLTSIGINPVPGYLATGYRNNCGVSFIRFYRNVLTHFYEDPLYRHSISKLALEQFLRHLFPGFLGKMIEALDDKGEPWKYWFYGQ